MQNRKYYLDCLYRATNIPFHILNSHQQVSLSYPDVSIPGFLVYGVAAAAAICDDPCHPVILALPQRVYIGYLRLNANTTILFGPISVFELDRERIRQDIQKTAFADECEVLCDLLLYAPKVSVENLQNCMTLAAGINNSTFLQASDFIIRDLADDTAAVGTGKLSRRESRISSDDPLMHTPREYEMLLADYIASGDFDGLVRFTQRPMPGHVGTLSYRPERNARYHYVVTVTIASRAAIRGGANSEDVYTWSDRFIRQMDSADDFRFEEELAVMMKTYCDLVRSAQEMPARSGLVESCQNYISTHILEEIRLGDLAAHCGLSPRVLSAKYDSECGESVMDTIHKTKLKEAYRLLRYTSCPVSEISASLGYSSQSYFTVIFKKYTGCTPGEYRKG